MKASVFALTSFVPPKVVVIVLVGKGTVTPPIIDTVSSCTQAIADWTIYIEGDTDLSVMVEDRAKSIARALLQRGEIYKQNLRDYAKAIADYTAAIQMNPNIEDAHRRRGECYEKIGETEKAQQDFAIEPKRN